VRTNQEKEEDDGDFDDGKWMMQLARERDDRSRELDKRPGDRTEKSGGAGDGGHLCLRTYRISWWQGGIGLRTEEGQKEGAGTTTKRTTPTRDFLFFFSFRVWFLWGRVLHIDADDADDDAAPRCRDSGWKLLRRAARGGG